MARIWRGEPAELKREPITGLSSHERLRSGTARAA
jgi:hypothetical protein